MPKIMQTSPIARRIAANLRTARKRAGLTQEQLAESAGMHRTEIGKLEKGARIPRADTLFKIAVCLGLDNPGPLFEGLQWTPPARLENGTWGVVDPTLDPAAADR